MLSICDFDNLNICIL